jgi:hypothetical protein
MTHSGNHFQVRDHDKSYQSLFPCLGTPKPLLFHVGQAWKWVVLVYSEASLEVGLDSEMCSPNTCAIYECEWTCILREEWRVFALSASLSCSESERLLTLVRIWSSPAMCMAFASLERALSFQIGKPAGREFI